MLKILPDIETLIQKNINSSNVKHFLELLLNYPTNKKKNYSNIKTWNAILHRIQITFMYRKMLIRDEKWFPTIRQPLAHITNISKICKKKFYIICNLDVSLDEKVYNRILFIVAMGQKVYDWSLF